MRVVLQFILLFTVAAAVSGCASPSPATPREKRLSLPESWVYVSQDSGYVRALPPGLQESLVLLRERLVDEQQSRYFTFFGHYTPETQDRVRALNEACNEAYMVSDHVLARDLTRELLTISQTSPEVWWQREATRNVERREFHDDWERFWLLNNPSRLSPYPIVKTGDL
jgi:hypothetical protein